MSIGYTLNYAGYVLAGDTREINSYILPTSQFFSFNFRYLFLSVQVASHFNQLRRFSLNILWNIHIEWRELQQFR